MKIIRARLKAYKGSKVAEFISVKGRIKALIEKNVGENFDFVLDDNGRKSVKSFGPDNIDPELVGKEAPIVDNVHFAKFNEDGTIDVIMMEKEGALPRESTVNQLNKIRKATKSTTIDDRVPKLKGANLDYERNYVDSGIESYEDFERKNKSFTPSWNLKHLKSPFKNESIETKKYVTCKNSPEDNYELHNKKDYEVVEYDKQPYGVGYVTIKLPNGKERHYPKTMFGEPFAK